LPGLDELSAAYLEAHPADAARELDRQPPLPVAGLLEGSPARIVAPVLAEMQPRAAAALLQCLDRERAHLMMAALSAPRATAILRQLPDEPRTDLLAALPGAMALACRALLRFPVDSVGARMDTSIPVLSEHARVAEALETLHIAATESEGVMTVDQARRLAGWASAAALLRADPSLALRAMSAPMSSVPALMPLAAALQAMGSGWSPVIAVIDTSRRPLGAITPMALANAMRSHASGGAETAGTTLGFVATQYWRAVTGLTDVALGVIVPLEEHST
jgi:Mg/Co/Ni transporter MgtE